MNWNWNMRKTQFFKDFFNKQLVKKQWNSLKNHSINGFLFKYFRSRDQCSDSDKRSDKPATCRSYAIQVRALDPIDDSHPVPCNCQMAKCVLMQALLKQEDELCDENGEVMDLTWHPLQHHSSCKTGDLSVSWLYHYYHVRTVQQFTAKIYTPILYENVLYCNLVLQTRIKFKQNWFGCVFFPFYFFYKSLTAKLEVLLLLYHKYYTDIVSQRLYS